MVGVSGKCAGRIAVVWTSVGASLTNKDQLLPSYKGRKWLDLDLPEQAQPWLDGRQRSVRKRKSKHGETVKAVQTHLRQHAWRWPKYPIYFFTDPHADADAMLASLLAAGGVKKTGARDADFELTQTGRQALFLVGGDCFDKGPGNLRLLRTLRTLSQRGARLRILAGNHDIRVMLGMRSVGTERSVANEHFFVRIGAKAIPFLGEINAQYLQGASALRGVPSERECKRLLYPGKHWLDNFPALAKGKLSTAAVAKEAHRMRGKIANFESNCEKIGISLRVAYAAALKWQQLFLHPKGEFYWFFRDMRLALRRGSFLFVHAGLDDNVAEMISTKGVQELNRRFRKQLRGPEFEFYYGSIANSFRTKYRPVDFSLSKRGVRKMHDSGIHAIVHGHRRLAHGQRIALRNGLLNVECDTTMDCNSRTKDGLKGNGAGVTVLHPEGWMMGISTDYPYAKHFDPKQLLSQ